MVADGTRSLGNANVLICLAHEIRPYPNPLRGHAEWLCVCFSVSVLGIVLYYLLMWILGLILKKNILGIIIGDDGEGSDKAVDPEVADTASYRSPGDSSLFLSPCPERLQTEMRSDELPVLASVRIGRSWAVDVGAWTARHKFMSGVHAARSRAVAGVLKCLNR